jgi:hypothetical protein
MPACRQPGCSRSGCVSRVGCRAFRGTASGVKNRNASMWVHASLWVSTTSSVAADPSRSGSLSGAQGGAPEDPLDERRRGSARLQVRGRVHPHPAVGARRVGDVPAPGRTLLPRGAREHDARPRVPAAQQRGLVRVVGEEEVVDLVGAAGEAALAESGREGVGPLGVTGCAVAPGVEVDDLEEGTRGRVRRRIRGRSGRGVGEGGHPTRLPAGRPASMRPRAPTPGGPAPDRAPAGSPARLALPHG